MKEGDKVPGRFTDAVSARYPGLIGRVREHIETAEREYTEKSGGPAGGFLWEHTRHVAHLAFELARVEGIDPVLAAVAALFHDAGKFAGGEYHLDDRPEEEDSALLAGSILEKEGAQKEFTARVERTLRALYKEEERRNRAADVVHDSDFLAKFGYLGVAGFFIKSTLRGKNLDRAIMDALSKELTYAAALPANMRTEAGRSAAAKKSRASLKFFRSLLGELNDVHGAQYRIESASVEIPGMKGGKARLRLVVPAACAACGGTWSREMSVEPGLKCRKLTAVLRCRGCGSGRSLSFCLPEIPAAKA
jgi:putative nucleotidyltransferase with HDIG domain